MTDPVLEILEDLRSGYLDVTDAIERAIEENTRINEETQKELGGTAK